MKKRLISLMIASTIIPTVTAFAGCTETKSTAEKNCEDKIRQLLEYDANINIEKNIVITYGFNVSYEITDAKEFLINFETKKPVKMGVVPCDKITYSVDKDFFYDFKNSYSKVEGQNEVELVTSLTSIYDPIDIIANREQVLKNE